MTGSSLILVQRILIVLLVLFVPAAARAQEQNQPSEASSQEKNGTAEGQAQKPAEPAVPEQGTAQPGTVVMPTSEGKPVSEPEQEEAGTQPSKEGGRIYIIKRGDTLWDISNTFLRDPFLWPFIWKANPYISNPDLIYPGNKLVIPSLEPIERAMQSPAEAGREPSKQGPGRQALRTAPTTTTAEEENTAPNRLILPEEAPIPLIDKYSMLNAGFVSQEESRDRIVGSLEGKTIFSYDDIVYVVIKSKENPVIGDKFIIYHPLERVKHPITGRNYGRLIRVLGVLQLVAKGTGDTYTARITLSFDAAGKDSMLTPYQEPALIYNTDQAKTKDITGYILEVVDGRTINAQTDILYLDKGSADGVESGDRFLVYARPQKKSYPRAVIGEAQVFLVKEHTATAVARKSTDAMAKGDVVEFKK